MTAIASTSRRPEDELVHAALLYRHPEQLRVAVAEFVNEGREAGEPVLVALPGAHLEAIRDVLDDGPSGLLVQDMAEVGRNPARLIPMLLDWLAGQDAPARVVSEALWPGRSYAETAECLRHEALTNYALARERVSILCPFDAEHLEAEVLAGAELTHPHLIDETGARPSLAFGDPLDVARGESWPLVEPEVAVTQLDFDGDLWRLRHALAGDPLLAALDPARRVDLIFAVNEAASNAVRHGDGQARARIWWDEGELVGEVSTLSVIDDPLVGRRTPRPEDTGGRGVWLINQMCDLVEVRSSPAGASVRMHVAA